MGKVSGNTFFSRVVVGMLAGLVGAMTVLRILTRAAFEMGVDTRYGPPMPVMIAAVVIFLTGILYAVVRGRFVVRGRALASQGTDVFTVLRFALCYGIALDLAMIGLQKWFGVQGHTPMALLDQPFSSFSGEDLSWAYYGLRPAFFNVVGGIQILGSLLLVFGRTRLLGVFLLLPVMLNICLLDLFYQFAPGELGQALVLFIGLLYLLWEERVRLLRLLIGEKTGAAGFLPVLGRLSVVLIPLLLILFLFRLPKRDAELYGKYRVTRIETDGKRMDLADCREPVLNRVYIDENKDFVFSYNHPDGLVLGNYAFDRSHGLLRVVWRYPVERHDTLVGMLVKMPGGWGLEGRMGKQAVRMEWERIR